MGCAPQPAEEALFGTYSNHQRKMDIDAGTMISSSVMTLIAIGSQRCLHKAKFRSLQRFTSVGIQYRLTVLAEGTSQSHDLLM